MFSQHKYASFILQKIYPVKKLKPCCCFSAAIDVFVKKVRILESLKQKENIPLTLYENGKYIVFFKGDNVCFKNNNSLLYLKFGDILGFKKYGIVKTVLLDVLSFSNPEECLFAMNLYTKDDSLMGTIETEVEGKFLNVRRSLYFLNQAEAEYVTQARGLINFSDTHKFCCYCGGSLTGNEGGNHKKCSKCNQTHYPNVSPIGICLIDDEKHEEVLLIRQERHPPGMYTCVAGFIEPGESLEKNVKREIAEEVGVNAYKIEYCTSQHWALPSCQLVLGCIATSLQKDFCIDTTEILEAKWFSAAELIDAVLRVRAMKDINEMTPALFWAPPRNAVSHYLMLTWLKKYHNFEVPDSKLS